MEKLEFEKKKYYDINIRIRMKEMWKTGILYFKLALSPIEGL